MVFPCNFKYTLSPISSTVIFSLRNGLPITNARTESTVILFAILLFDIGETFIVEELSDTLLVFVSIVDEAECGW
jgi:hypothetical protein